MADTTPEEDTMSEVVSENAVPEKQESREEMLSRHRKETNDLQNKEVALKKAVAKGSKAEQKAKKKQVDEEISILSTKLKEAQAKELASLGYNGNTDKQNGDIDNLVNAIAGVSVTNQAEQSSKPNKHTKRRGKRAQEEAARERRIQEEQSQIVNDRIIEDEKLEQKLEPLGFTINEIKADGHCLYRAVEDQLALRSGGSSPCTYQELREMVASYMRKNASDFLPFFHSENAADGESADSITERFEKYCRDIESTAAWGGQLELGALTHCLKKHIMIYSGSFPDVEMGKEYKQSNGTGSSSKSSILLSFHRHAFGLGKRIRNNTSMALADTKEQDGFLPIANVSRIMKKSLPANAKISKEAKQTVQECVSEFINFVTGEASDKCQREKRKTINGDDLLWAMTTLGFENYVGPLKDYLNKYRESDEAEKNNAATQEDAYSPTNGHGEKIEDISTVHDNSIVSMGFAASPDDHDLWEFKTFSSNYLGIGIPDYSRRSRGRIDYGEQMHVAMISNRDEFENGKSYAFDENSKRVTASVVGEHGVEW